MATTLDEIVVRIDADISGLRRGLNRIERQSLKTGKVLARSFRGADAAAIAFRATIVRLAGPVALGFLAKNIITTASQFQQLRLQLETVTGSADFAAITFDKLVKFAAKTPFEVQNLVEAFIKLQAAGITPTIPLLESFGNTAAAFGRDITDFAGAVVGAVTGETERLKSFGIIARLEQDNIRLIFRGTERVVTRDAKSITDALEEIGNTDFAGGMERQSQSAAGSFSNLQDSISAFFDEIGKSGLIDALTASMKTLGSVVDNLRKDLFPTLTEEVAQLKTEIQGIRSQRGRALGGVVPERADPELVGRLARLAELTQRLEVQRQEEAAVTAKQKAQQKADEQKAAASSKAITAQKKSDKAANERLKTEAKITAQIEAMTAALGLDIETQELRLLFADQESEELRVQIRLLKIKNDLGADAARDAEADVRRSENLRTQLEAAEVARREGLGVERKEVDDLQNAANELGLTFTSAFEDAVIEGRGLRSVLKGIVDDIQRIIIRLTVTEPIAKRIKAIFNETGSNGSSGGGGGFFGKILGIAGSFLGGFGGGFAGPPGGPQAGVGGGVFPGGLHSGGVVGRNRSFTRNVSPALFAGAPHFASGGIVGLKSNEVPAILHKGETVRTTGQEAALSRGGGRGSINVTQILNISPGVPEAVRREVSALRPALRRDAVSAVAQARRLIPGF